MASPSLRLNLLHAAALGHDAWRRPNAGRLAEARARLLRSEKLRLTRSQQAIVLRALEIGPDNVDADAVGVWTPPKRFARPRGKACRPALPPFSKLPPRSARWAPKELKIVSVGDDGEALDLVVSGGPNPAQAGAAGLGKGIAVELHPAAPHPIDRRGRAPAAAASSARRTVLPRPAGGS